MSNVKKNFLYSAGFQVINMVVPLFTMPYITRVIGANGIGMYSYAMSVASYFSLFILLGLNNYGSRTIAAVRNDKKILSCTFIEIYIFQLFCGFLVLLCYFVYLLLFCKNVSLALVFIIHILSVVLDITWFFNGLEQFRLLAVRNTVIKILTMGLIFIFIKDEGDLLKYCMILTGGTLFASVYFWVYVKGIIEWVRPSVKGIVQHIKPNLTLFITVLVISLYKILDKIMLGLMSSYDQVGFFEITEKVTNIPMSFISAFGLVMLPHISNKLSLNNTNSERTTYLSILFVMFMSTSMPFGIMAVSREFVPFFFGQGYNECIKLFLIILPSCLFLGFANVLRTQYLIPLKMDSIYIKSTSLGALVNVVLNVMLIPFYGAVGASVSTLAAEIAVCAYQAFKLRLLLPITKYVRDSIPFVLSGVCMFLIVYWCPAMFDNALSTIIIKICIGVLFYSISMITICYIYRDRYVILNDYLKRILAPSIKL